VIERIKHRLQEAADLYSQMAEQLAEPTAQVAEVLIAALREGHTIYICGDGGSAAQAQHVAGELVGRFMVDRPALPCVALTTDTSVLTAVANDYSFAQVFERQVEALVREGAVLLLLSTSGSSANVLKAATRARKKGAKAIGLGGQSLLIDEHLQSIILQVGLTEMPVCLEIHELLLIRENQINLAADVHDCFAHLAY